MSDSQIFAAVPDGIEQGAGVTGQVGRFAEQLAQAYDDATQFDENDPPWGEGDETAREFEEKYVLPHAQLRDALHLLSSGITAAGQMTGNSAKAFAKAQDDATAVIHDQGGGGRR